MPSPLTESDIGTLIQLSPSFQKGSLNHLIFSHSTIISNGFINQILTRFNDYFMEMAKNSPTKLKSSQEINNNINNKLRTSTGDSKSKLSNSNSNINNSNDNLRNSNVFILFLFIYFYLFNFVIFYLFFIIISLLKLFNLFNLFNLIYFVYFLYYN